MRRFARFAAIDWSGAMGERLKGIAVAECAAAGGAPALVPPPHGARFWSRGAVRDWLLARADEDLLVGLDFSAALPFADQGAYLPGHPGSPADARALWEQVDRLCAEDPFLAATRYVMEPAIAPYFRHGGVTGAFFAGADRNGRLRVVEREKASGNATSSFNLVGAAQVGKASLTGMRMLHQLGRRIAVWPFDPPPSSGALIVEIYTSIAAVTAGRRPGATKMLSYHAMNAALRALGSPEVEGDGPIDDHRSDAIVSAAWLRNAAQDPHLWNPARLAGEPDLARTEGWTFGVP